MRNIVVISLLLTFLSLQTPLHEVIKLPVLISHYLEHKELDDEMNLFSFLDIHYLDNVVDGDHDRDMQLPFKHCSSPLFLVLSTVTNKVQLEFRNILPETRQTLTEYKNPFLHSTISHNIWQPPRRY